VQAEEWLKDGVAHIETQSKSRSAEFYSGLSNNMQMYDSMVRDCVELHEKTERLSRMQGLEYMVQHLVSRGVGKYVPSLEGHLVNIRSILGGKWELLYSHK
jgi:hypothetical protein